MVESRVAVPEQIAKETHEAIADLRAELRLFRSDMNAGFNRLDIEARADSRWLLGLMLTGFGGLLAVMAQGFHWL